VIESVYELYQAWNRLQIGGTHSSVWSAASGSTATW